jgi:hypothetical protein
MIRHSLVILFALLLTQPVWAQATDRVEIRSGAHPTYDRITFDWPKNVPYQIKREGQQVTVIFAAPANFAGAVTSGKANLKRLSGAQQERGTDSSRFSFTIAANAQLKDFRIGNRVVFDVIGPAVPSTPPAAATAAAEQPVEIKPYEAKNTVKEPTIKEEPKEEAIKAPEAIATAPELPTITAPAPSTPVISQAPAPVIAAAPVDVARSPEEALPEKPQLPELLPAPLSASTIPVPAAGQPPVLALQLNPSIAVPFAAYQRGDYVYLILERKLSLPAGQLLASQHPQLQLQPLNLTEATGWRFVMPAGGDLRVDRSGTSWLIYVAGEKRKVPVTLALKAEPDYALGARLFLPVVNPPKIIRLIDPVIGDQLSVVPLLQAGDAMSSPRRYADLTALATAQGMVIAHQAENLAVRSVANGVEITTSGGLRLSPAQDTGIVPRLDTTRPANRALLFDFATWRGPVDQSFTRARQRLLQNIVDVGPAERDRARLELARFYFAHGFASEAVSLLNYVKERLPDIFVRPEFLALHGAAQILAGNPAEGLKDFANSELNDVADRPLWEALAEAQLRNYAVAAAKFNATIGFIDDYPEAIFNRFALMALESLIATKQEAKADQWLQNWRESERHEEFMNTPAVFYIEGVVHYQLRNPDQAAKYWRLAAAGKDRLYRTRAELALIDFDLQRGKLTPAAAAQRLENQRFAWRGDALEWEILRRLGMAYFQAEKFRDGFLNLERARKLYPNEVGNADLVKLQSDIFHDLFVTDKGAKMTPLEALSLYQDYRYLVTETAVARPIMRSLADRLVAIDLLEQAAQLLQDLQKDSDPQERARLGTRVAGLRLLDKQPDKAIAALEASATDGLPEDLQQERLLLRARALNDLGQSDAAKKLLSERQDPVAQGVLADMAWRTANWPQAAAALRQVVAAIPRDKPLSNESAQQIVRLTTALALADDRPALKNVAEEFGAAIRETSQKEIFSILTSTQNAGSLRDVAARVSKSTAADPFRAFLDRYRTTTPARAKE